MALAECSGTLNYLGSLIPCIAIGMHWYDSAYLQLLHSAAAAAAALTALCARSPLVPRRKCVVLRPTRLSRMSEDGDVEVDPLQVAGSQEVEYDLKFETGMYKVREDEYVIDVQRLQGELFIFMDVCGRVLSEIRA